MVWGPIRGGGAVRRALTALAAVAVLACAAALPALGAAAAPSKDLGGPDYDGYCKHLGFVRSQVTASKEWACVHADTTTSPLDVQAACEFSFPQRPIAAVELGKGIPYTWQCFAAEPGKVVLPAGAGGGLSSPVAAAVRRALIPSGHSAKIGILVRRGRYLTSFHAPGFGRLTLSWYKPARHGRGTLIASATVTFPRASTRTVAIMLSAKGKRLLKHAARLNVSGRGSFVANASSPVGTTATFTLRR